MNAAMNDDTYRLRDTRRSFIRRAALMAGALGAGAGTSFRTDAVRAAEPTLPAVPKVGIMVFEGVQIIDFAGPYEVFGEAGYDVFTIGPTKSPLTTVMNLTITPRYSFADAPAVDVLLTPGGDVGPPVLTDRVIEWIVRTSAQTKHTLSVCNGAFFLGKAGLLKGLSATTYYGAIEHLAHELPDTKVVSDRRFVDNGHIITTAGLSSGIDATRQPSRWITASIGNTVRMIPVDDVLFFQAQDKYTRVVTAKDEAFIRTPLKELIAALDAGTFWQVHRSVIVRVGAVHLVEWGDDGHLKLRLRGRPELLPVSSAFQHRFRGM